MVNILGLGAAVMICKGKIAEDGGTAELLCPSISYTAYIIPNTVNRGGEKKWRMGEKSKGTREGWTHFCTLLSLPLAKTSHKVSKTVLKRNTVWETIRDAAQEKRAWWNKKQYWFGVLNSLIPLPSSLALMILNETLILLQMLLPSKANQLLGRAWSGCSFEQLTREWKARANSKVFPALLKLTFALTHGEWP